MVIAVTYIDHMGSDLSVVNAARVSFGKKSDWELKGDPDDGVWDQDGVWSLDLEFKLSDRDTKLIRYLAKHEHISPFGHAFASFHVKAPIFVHAQLLKHKFLRANTISRRYVDSDVEFYEPDVWRGRSADKKQGSEGVVEVLYDFPWVDYGSSGDYKQYLETCEAGYKSLLEKGVAPEMARMVLPQSLMTEWYWSGSLDAFASMCKLRLKEDTQYESRLVAQQISDKMAELFPVSWQALMTDYTSEKRIEELEAKLSESEALLAKAMEGFDEIKQHCANFGRGVPAIDERIVERCEDTAANALAELSSTIKGQDDE